MSRIDTLVCTDARKTKYRFVVLTMIFLVYAINYADRTILARYCLSSLMSFISIILKPGPSPVCFSSAMR